MKLLAQTVNLVRFDLRHHAWRIRCERLHSLLFSESEDFSSHILSAGDREEEEEEGDLGWSVREYAGGSRGGEEREDLGEFQSEVCLSLSDL